MVDLDPISIGVLWIWLTLFGACLGSFLNVVVYRLPRHKSLSDPPSHCPNCGHRIRWYDNVPVFGWIRLNGKCRDCRSPISVRYPIVEGFCGFVFAVVALLALSRPTDASLAEFLCFVIALSSLILTFLAAGLIEQEKNPVPDRLFLPSLILGPMVPYLVQETYRVPLFVSSLVLSANGDDRIVQYPMIFGSVALCLCIAFVGLKLLGKKERVPLYSAALLGLYFGVAGVAILSVSAIVFFFGRKLFRPGFWTWHLAVTATTLTAIVFLLQNG